MPVEDNKQPTRRSFEEVINARSRTGRRDNSRIQRSTSVITIACASIAATKRRDVACFLVFFHVGTTKKAGSAKRTSVGWHSAYLVLADMKRVPTARLDDIGQATIRRIRDSVPMDEVLATIDQSLAGVVNDLKGTGSVKVLPVLDDDLLAILGSPAISTGRQAQLSDTPAWIYGPAGVYTVRGAVQHASVTAFSELPVTAVLGGASAGTLAQIGITALGAFAGGWMVGRAADELLISPIIRVATGGESRDIADPFVNAWGSAWREWQDAPDDPVVGDSSGEPAPDSDAPTDTDDEEEADTGEDDSSEDDSSEDDSSEDDSSEDDSSEDDNEAGDAGTTLPPDFDFGGNAIGGLLLYMMTKLGANEAKQQLKALEITAGGDLGVFGTISPTAWLSVDQLLGGTLMRLFKRNLDAQRGSRGYRDTATWLTEIDPTKLRNYGLTYPMPLDLIFLGETSKSRGIIR